MPDKNRPHSINQLFSRMMRPAYSEIHAFVVFCIDRIEHLLETESSQNAFLQLKATGTVEADLAEQAIIDSNSFSLQNSSAAKAVGEAVRHCTRTTGFHYSDDYVERARLVALYCQWALSREQCPPDPDDDREETDDEENESGLSWLRQQIEEREQNEQLTFVFDNFPHWIKG
ncbi:hypothetical protein [Gimesia sp.]|uniref:hypothetical protein n=1 Tax=Gimesia sp. TaxID=2024833 RepID=UPI003A955B35